MMEQLSIFDLTMPYISVDKPIRLLEMFAGIGSQAMALRDLGAIRRAALGIKWSYLKEEKDVKN